MATVDVLLPVYRGRRWVASTVETLREQTFSDWRLIVVDDACPEQTGTYVVELFPEATLITLDRNRRAAFARNVGARRGDAPFIALLDQDDLWDPTKLDKQVAALTERPTFGACHTDARLIDEEGRDLGEADTNKRRQLDWDRAPLNDLLRAQFEANRVKMASALIRREAWDDVGGQDEHSPGGEDWSFWLKMLAQGWRLSHIPEPLHHWRQHGTNTSSSEERTAGMIAARRRYAIRYARRLGPRLLTRMLLR